MSNYSNGMLGLSYSTTIITALESMHMLGSRAFAPCLWSIETFLHSLAKRCHTGQINDWHRLYIENTCVSILRERGSFCDDLPGGEYSIPLIAYVLSVAQAQYGEMNVIQCFRYGMMNYIHGIYGKSSDLVNESGLYFIEQTGDQKERIRKKARMIYSRQLQNSDSGKKPYELGRV